MPPFVVAVVGAAAEEGAVDAGGGGAEGGTEAGAAGATGAAGAAVAAGVGTAGGGVGRTGAGGAAAALRSSRRALAPLSTRRSLSLAAEKERRGDSMFVRRG